METLVPAFVAVLLAQLVDRPAWLAAVLGDRYGPRGVLAGTVLAQAAGFALAAWAGALLAPAINPNARTLLLALALLAAGGGSLLRPRLSDRLERWRIGGFATTLLGIFILAFGDRSQFLVLAFAWGANPLLAAAGGTAAATAVASVAVVVGERGWRGWPHRPVRIGISALFLLSGAALALKALGLL